MGDKALFSAKEIQVAVRKENYDTVSLCRVHPNKENIEIVPSKKTIQSFFKATESEQTEMKFEESENE